MRSFIAIELSKEAKSELARVVHSLKEAGADAKWVSDATLHLTLKFLGDAGEADLEKVSKSIGEIASQVASFDLTLDSVGVFPDWNRVRVIWAGVGEGADLVTALADRVEEAAVGLGFAKEEREFKAHLTIGRMRSPKGRDRLKKATGSISVKPVKFRVSEIILFRSELSSDGAVHTPVARFNLGT